MKCLVCSQIVEPGEQVFWGTQIVYRGPGESDFDYFEGSGGLVGAVHLFCLESPAAISRMPNTVVPVLVSVEPESVVERSDALSLFEGVGHVD